MLGEPAGAGDEECPSEAQISCLLDRALDEETAAAIEAHMDRCAACRALVAELVRFRSSSAGDEAEAPAPPEEAAVLIAERYEIIEPVGSGGMGIVYLARDRRLARRVAIKMLRFGAESRSQAQLLKEAQTLARLCHPSIVVVHDVGTFEDQVFMAMEYVGGTSLRYWLEREARLPWHRRAAIRSACSRWGRRCRRRRARAAPGR